MRTKQLFTLDITKFLPSHAQVHLPVLLLALHNMSVPSRAHL